MALTQHMRRHLNAIQNWINRVRLKPIPVQKRQAAAKGVPWRKWNTYLDRLEARVASIFASTTWPNVTDNAGRRNVEVSEIHDHLEKRTPEFRD